MILEPLFLLPAVFGHLRHGGDESIPDLSLSDFDGLIEAGSVLNRLLLAARATLREEHLVKKLLPHSRGMCQRAAL